MNTRSGGTASKSRFVRRGFLVAGTLVVAVGVVLGSALPAEASVFSSLKKAVAKVAGVTTKSKTRCLNGEVASISIRGKVGRLNVKYARGKKIVAQPMGLTQKQYDTALGHSIRKGSSVKVCTKGVFNGKTATLLGNAKNLAPKGEEQTYGNVDGGGSSGGAHGS